MPVQYASVDEELPSIIDMTIKAQMWGRIKIGVTTYSLVTVCPHTMQAMLLCEAAGIGPLPL